MIEKVSVCVGFHGVVAEERMTLTWLFGNSIYPGPLHLEAVGMRLLKNTC